MEEPKELTNVMAGAMIMFALFIDAIQALLTLLPIIGWILAPVAGVAGLIIFYFWLKNYGIKFSSPRQAKRLVVGFIVEMIPLLNALPTWTLAITLIVMKEKAKNLSPESINKIEGVVGRLNKRKDKAA
jgi:hypothetical protein